MDSAVRKWNHLMMQRLVGAVLFIAVVCGCCMAQAADSYFVNTHLIAGSSPIAEPFSYLHGGRFTGAGRGAFAGSLGALSLATSRGGHCAAILSVASDCGYSSNATSFQWA
jgi:hypothetical protein